MLEWPHDSTNRSRAIHLGSAGSCRITFWNSRYAAGARLMAVPGWPLPTFCTESMARTRAVSTARLSRSVHSRAVVVGLLLTLVQGSFPHVEMPVTWRLPGVVEPTATGTCTFSSGL